MAVTYQEYIHEKLKKMSLMERVNAQSNQIQLVQRANYENLIKEENKKREALASSLENSNDVQLVQRISYNLNQFTPEVESLIAQEEALSNIMERMFEIKRNKSFQREELYEIIDHIPNDPNKRKTGQEVMMSAMYGEEALPNGKDLIET